MDQASYWMLLDRRLSDQRPLLSPHIAASSPYCESWEEKAFAEDSAGRLGGCTWPPRFYSCSFCGREFRSAQALGGHMNVHRRDRARLRQSPSPQDEGHDESPGYLGAANDPHLGSWLRYTSNPNPNSTIGALAASPRLIKNHVWSEHILISPSYSSSTRVRENKIDHPISTQMFSIQEFMNEGCKSNLAECGKRRQRDPIESDDKVIAGKKRRIDPISSNMASFSLASRQQLYPEVLKLCPSPGEELDLELRLGNPPTVN